MAKPVSYDFLTGNIYIYIYIFFFLFIKNEIFVKFIEGSIINDIQDLDLVEIYCLYFLLFIFYLIQNIS